MWTTKQKFFSKNKMIRNIFEPMFINFFVMLPTNPRWKLERKTLGQMFFKEKLRIMIGIVKHHTVKQFKPWISAIEKNGEHRINAMEVFERINAYSLNHICFGLDNNDDMFDFLWYDRNTDTFTEKKVTITEAVPNLSIQCMVRRFRRLSSPVGILWLLFKINLSNNEVERNVEENSRRLYKHVDKYVQERKSGVTKSQMEGADLLSHYLANPDIFTDDHVIGGMIGTIFPGIETS